jgi:uncharacterized protein
VRVQSAYNVVVPLPAQNSDQLYALFNTFAGSIDLIDQSIVDGLKTLSQTGTRLIQLRTAASYERSAKLPDEVLDYLDARGYLFDSLDEERIQARFVYEEMLRLHREIAGQPLAIIPTYNCDLKCPYCWQRVYDMDSPIISERMVDRAFDAISKLVERQPHQPVELAIFGGEPLQDIPELRDRVIQICELGKREGFSVMAMSNGVGLAKAAPHLAGKIGQIQVTIDGPQEIHRKRRPLPKGDSFAAMVEGVDKALEFGIPIKVRVNVDMTNLPRLPELADLARERGWLDTGKLDFHAAPVKNHNPSKQINPESELLEELLKLVDRDERMSVFDLTGFGGIKYFQGFKESAMFSLHRFFNCEAQINFWLFDVHGDIYACWEAAGTPDLAVGRFDPEVELNERRLNMWRARTTLDIASCSGCTSQPHCGGGCQFHALEHGGSVLTSSCDSLMEGYTLSIQRNADWLRERAHKGDHAVGLVTAAGVVTPVTRQFGLIDDEGAKAGFDMRCA